jgi:F-type H+-transporting ATPase subunit gamma
MAGSGQIRQLRQRIKTVKSTQKITRAMEMIAASRIVKAQRRMAAAKPYAEQITEVIKGLATSTEVDRHPLLAPHAEVRRTAIIVVTSDRGLAGAYNTNVLKRAEVLVDAEEAEGHEVALYCVGKKATDYFSFRNRTPVRSWDGVSDTPTIEAAQEVGRAFTVPYAAGELDRVWLVYTDFQSALTQVPNALQLLPVDGAEFAGGSDVISPAFIFEPDPATILDLLIPSYVEAKVFAGMLESAASEHASRQRAMKSATDNAGDVIENLSRVMNAARQEMITTEISEIVGGAEALSGGK